MEYYLSSSLVVDSPSGIICNHDDNHNNESGNKDIARTALDLNVSYGVEITTTSTNTASEVITRLLEETLLKSLQEKLCHPKQSRYLFLALEQQQQQKQQQHRSLNVSSISVRNNRQPQQPQQQQQWKQYCSSGNHNNNNKDSMSSSCAIYSFLFRYGLMNLVLLLVVAVVVPKKLYIYMHWITYF